MQTLLDFSARFAFTMMAKLPIEVFALKVFIVNQNESRSQLRCFHSDTRELFLLECE